MVINPALFARIEDEPMNKHKDLYTLIAEFIVTMHAKGFNVSHYEIGIQNEITSSPKW